MSTMNNPLSVRRWAAGLTLSVVLLLAQACDSGSSGGAAAELCIDFTPSNQPAPGTVTARLAADSGCSLAEIEIVATDINDVFAFQSVINYDPDVAGFLGFSLVDSELENGADVTVVAEEEVFGEVTIGATRIGPTGVDIVGEGVLIKLAFARFSFDGRAGEFELNTQCLLNSATPPVPKAEVCSGGTIAVR